jgi:hypothetical protein
MGSIDMIEASGSIILGKRFCIYERIMGLKELILSRIYV